MGPLEMGVNRGQSLRHGIKICDFFSVKHATTFVRARESIEGVENKRKILKHSRL